MSNSVILKVETITPSKFYNADDLIKGDVYQDPVA